MTASAYDFDVKGTKVNIGGYAKLMLVYDLDGNVETGPFDRDLAGAYDSSLDDNPLADKTISE